MEAELLKNEIHFHDLSNLEKKKKKKDKNNIYFRFSAVSLTLLPEYWRALFEDMMEERARYASRTPENKVSFTASFNQCIRP